MSKLIVFGLDGGLLRLVEQWIDELPNLKKILKEGSYGKLKSTYPPLTSPAWASMFTGRNPAKLGMFGFINNLFGAKGKFMLNSSVQYNHLAIWNTLNRNGKKVGIFNLPLTFPPHKVDSFMVCGVGSPTAMKSTFTYPPELKKELDKVTGEYEILPPILLTAPGNEEQYLAALDETVRKREQAAAYLMENKPWDLFICVFFVLDMVQHRYWHHMDESHIRHTDNRYRDVIKNYYKKVDAAIGRLLEKAPDGTNVLVTSDHGFGPANGMFAVNKWLEKNGYLKINPQMSRGIYNTTLINIRNFLLARLSPNMTRRIAKMLPKSIATRLTVREAHRNEMVHVYENIDWAHTQAYGMGEVGMIYINLKGRESEGIVEPGEEYENICKDIVSRLKEVKNPDTGEKINIDIHRKEEVYSGPYYQEAPDILYRMERYHQSVLIKQDDVWFAAGLSGHHIQDGIFAAWGPDIKRNENKLEGLNIYDITPTILHTFGLPVSKDIDGRVLTDIFKSDSEPGMRQVEYHEDEHETERVREKIKQLKKLKKL